MRQSLVIVCVMAAVVVGCKRPEEKAAVGQEAATVRVAPVKRFDAPAVVALSGSVVSPENPSVASFLVAGRVLRVGPREGDALRKGQVLAVVDPADYELGVDAAVAQVQAARAVMEKAEAPARPEVLEQARVGFERAREEHARMKQLFEAKSLAPNDYEKCRALYESARQQYELARAGGQKEDRAQARAVWEQAATGERVARKRLADATLLSPLDGYVAARLVEVGDMAAPGRPAFQIVRLDPVEISVGVPEKDIALVRVGQKASVRIPALPGETFAGTVRVMNVAAEPASRTFMVRIAVANPRHVLRLGMIAEVEIAGDRTVKVMSVPGEAVVRDAHGAMNVYVYFADKGRVYARRVETGTVYGTEVEVKSGLEGTEAVVVAGQHKLREGDRVTVEAGR